MLSSFQKHPGQRVWRHAKDASHLVSVLVSFVVVRLVQATSRPVLVRTRRTPTTVPERCFAELESVCGRESTEGSNLTATAVDLRKGQSGPSGAGRHFRSSSQLSSQSVENDSHATLFVNVYRPSGSFAPVRLCSLALPRDERQSWAGTASRVVQRRSAAFVNGSKVHAFAACDPEQCCALLR